MLPEPTAPRLRGATAAPALVLAAALALGGCSDDAGSDADPGAEATGTATSQPAATGTETGTEAPATGTPTTGDDGATASARGELVEGFPTDVVPVPPDARVTLSTVVQGDGVLTVSVAGETERSPAELMEFVRGPLTERGFTEVAGGPPEGGAAATFVRSEGVEVLSVTVLPGDGVRRFTIGGQVRPG